jgi:hypothetical protein
VGFSYWEGLNSLRTSTGWRAVEAREPIEGGTTKSFANRRGILEGPAEGQRVVRVPLAVRLMVAPRPPGANARGVSF